MENLVMTEDFWRGKRVFLTGHTGFKGAWLSLWLQKLGAIVTGYALAAPTRPSLFEVARVADGMQSVIGDITDGPALESALQAAAPEIVIHMAAQALVRASYQDPVRTYATNVMGLVNLYEAVRATAGIRAVVNVTSDKCYENREWHWGYRETDAMGGHDPYSNSKGCAELVTSAYRNSFFGSNSGVALATARAGNVIGGGDWAPDRLVPDILGAIDTGKPIPIRYPNAIRPWQHVLEPLSGYLALAQRLYVEGSEFAEGWNFGPNDIDAKPVAWLAEALTRRIKYAPGWACDQGEHPHEATYLKLDCSKAHARLGWRPRWSIERTIEQIVAWHQNWSAGSDMQKITLDQIDQYERDGNAAA